MNKRNPGNLVFGFAASGGRNHAGRITTYHRGGGHKRLLRKVNFHYKSVGAAEAAATNPNTNRLSFDPGRGAPLVVGDVSAGYPRLASQEERDGSLGNGGSVALSKVAAHTKIHSIELTSGRGAQLIRGAGCHGTVVNQLTFGSSQTFTRVRLPSGEERLIRGDCRCRIGIVGGVSRTAWSLALHRRGQGKAGRSRWLGRRPTVRGTARNPVDHPHGGGQGKTSGGRPSVTPWSVPKGVRTSAGRGAAFVVVPR
jgi:large subunit ribosomal protein L2